MDKEFDKIINDLFHDLLNKLTATGGNTELSIRILEKTRRSIYDMNQDIETKIAEYSKSNESDILNCLITYKEQSNKLLDSIEKLINQQLRTRKNLETISSFLREWLQNHLIKRDSGKIVTGLNSFVRDSLTKYYFKESENEGINFSVEYQAPESVSILIDPYFYMSFINLIENSKQALESVTKSNKKIQIKTYLEDLYGCISVKDNGPGIAPEHIGKIFRPLFTTKQNGNGYGLFSLKERVTSLGGEVTFETKYSAEEGFTKFIVKLPIYINGINKSEMSDK